MALEKAIKKDARCGVYIADVHWYLVIGCISMCFCKHPCTIVVETRIIVAGSAPLPLPTSQQIRHLGSDIVIKDHAWPVSHPICIHEPYSN